MMRVMMFEDGFVPLRPVDFFQLEVDCHYLKKEGELNTPSFLLPSLGVLCQEESFAKVHMGWNEEGLSFLIRVDSSFKDVFYPEISRGDSVELFIDTRDVKTSGYNTKFCHHFFFLPQEIEGVKAGEITRFRTEDAHELCDPKELRLQGEIYSKGYQLKIFIPSHCLHGYDPEASDHIGFTYRIHRCGKSPQHFSAVTDEFAIEQQPSLWSSLHLIHENGTLRKSSKRRR